MTYRSVFLTGLMTVVSAGRCATTPAPTTAADAAQRRQLALLMPSRLEIVEPFTRLKSFDEDATFDGIELLLQAVNSLDNPGLMIVGDVRIELYEYVPASGDQKGRRLEHWNVELSTAEDQRTYWNQPTQMYEFRLQVNRDRIAPAERYVLAVTYNSPLGEHLSDECVIEFRAKTGPLGGLGQGGDGPVSSSVGAKNRTASG